MLRLRRALLLRAAAKDIKLCPEAARASVDRRLRRGAALLAMLVSN